MGVLACDRKDCENIMCDTYIPDVGYICYECVSEFKESSFVEKGSIKQQLADSLSTFMDTVKGSNNEVVEDIDDFLNEYTRY